MECRFLILLWKQNSCSRKSSIKPNKAFVYCYSPRFTYVLGDKFYPCLSVVSNVFEEKSEGLLPFHLSWIKLDFKNVDSSLSAFPIYKSRRCLLNNSKKKRPILMRTEVECQAVLQRKE